MAKEKKKKITTEKIQPKGTVLVKRTVIDSCLTEDERAGLVLQALIIRKKDENGKIVSEEQDQKSLCLPYTNITREIGDKLMNEGAFEANDVYGRLVKKYKHTYEDVLELKVFNQVQAYQLLHYIQSLPGPHVEFEFAGTYYPACVEVGMGFSWMGQQICTIDVPFKYCNNTDVVRGGVGGGMFIDPTSDNYDPMSLTIKKVLELNKFKSVDKNSLGIYAEKKNRWKKIVTNDQTKMFDLVGPVIVQNRFLWSVVFEQSFYASKEKPSQVILDHELEFNAQPERHDPYDAIIPEQTIESIVEEYKNIPILRAFCMLKKEYVYVDVDNLIEHHYDQTKKDRIVIDAKSKNILDKIFNTETKNIFGDMFNGRHGGMIILANGNPGVGKTLTAEVFSEYAKRPLYVLEMGELGTNLTNVEDNLTRIFARATRWNAVLLFDEAEIFLSKRGDDLDRNAIVGVFLRLLDHYDGTMFLTTNREEVIDEAFRSRITLRLNYPDLNSESRYKIWMSLLGVAGFSISDVGGLSENVSSVKLNGRQIRNVVRLLRVNFDGNTISNNDIIGMLEFVSK